MAEANATLIPRADLSARRTQGENQGLTNLDYIDPNLVRDPEYYVELFSVADRDFKVSRPGLNLNVGFGHNPDCLKDKASYQYLMSIPSPYHVVYAEQVNGALVSLSYKAEKVMIDLLNPNQKSLSMDGYIQPDTVIGWGDDLIARGVFGVRRERCKKIEKVRDLNNGKKLKYAEYIPPAEEVAAAFARKELFYNGALNECNSLEMGDPGYFRQHLTWNPQCHDACEYFGIEKAWHPKRVHKSVPMECRVCKTDIKLGAAFHFLPNGRICVNDWDAAIDSGAVTEADRPKK